MRLVVKHKPLFKKICNLFLGTCFVLVLWMYFFAAYKAGEGTLAHATSVRDYHKKLKTVRLETILRTL